MTALHLRAHVLPDGGLRDLFVVDGRITSRPQESARTVLEGGWVLPGLVDAHAHLALASPEPDADEAGRVRASLLAQLDAGVLLVREPGGPGYASADVDDADLPAVVTAGRMIVRPGRYFPGLGHAVEPEGAVAAAEDELARSRGAWVKVIADWFGSDGRIGPSWPAGLLADVVDRVHELGGRVAVHATCREALDEAVLAGVDSIEHAVGLRPEHLEGVLEHGIALVPTLVIRPGVLDAARRFGFDDHACAHLDDEFDGLAETLRAAAGRGVRILAGTDAGMVPHGLVAQEIALLHAAGIPAEQALAGGSWEARRFLGMDGLGTDGLVEGSPADLVALDTDPREDLGVLERPALVLRSGRVVQRR